MAGVSEKGGHWWKGSKVHILTIHDGRRGGFCQMAGKWSGRKFGQSDATYTGSEKSTGEDGERRPEEAVRPEKMVVFGSRLPVGGFWMEWGRWRVLFWLKDFTWRTRLSELGVSWGFIRPSTMKVIKAASSAFGTPLLTLEFYGALSNSETGGLISWFQLSDLQISRPGEKML